jgi:homoserine dehydrogenase
VRELRVAFLGFGTVGRALHALLERRRDDLARELGVECRVTGIASRRLGWIADVTGLDALQPAGAHCDDVHAWLTASGAGIVFEAVPLDPMHGQPALDYLRAALQHGAHVISANKGPVVHGHRELMRLATANGREYRFESAVMDGAPVFSLVRECLSMSGLHAIRGVFTSTATIVLEAIERGATLADGVAEAQRLGIAEADPTYDLDGWDSAVKLCALANVLLGGELRPMDVQRAGIRSLGDEEIRRAASEGLPYRLQGEVTRTSRGDVEARVAPIQCRLDGPLGVVHGASLVMHYEADVFPGGLTVTSHEPDAVTTAYGMLADLVAILKRCP